MRGAVEGFLDPVALAGLAEALECCQFAPKKAALAGNARGMLREAALALRRADTAAARRAVAAAGGFAEALWACSDKEQASAWRSVFLESPDHWARAYAEIGGLDSPRGASLACEALIAHFVQGHPACGGEIQASYANETPQWRRCGGAARAGSLERAGAALIAELRRAGAQAAWDEAMAAERASLESGRPYWRWGEQRAGLKQANANPQSVATALLAVSALAEAREIEAMVGQAPPASASGALSGGRRL